MTYRHAYPFTPDTDDWRHRAKCRDEDSELFFPAGTGHLADLQAEQAKAVCRTCPVVADCLSWALDTGQDHGVWGGLTEAERRALRRRQGTAPKPTTADIPIPADLTPREATALLRQLQRHGQPVPPRVQDLALEHEHEQRRSRRLRIAALLTEEAAS